MKKLAMLMALMTLTACDRLQRPDVRVEREDRRYREAMEDYRAGRLEAAVKGFEKSVVADPSNASARFQLACLLQDSLRDYAGAYCAYREYLLLRPGSDKAALAKDRLAMCEKELAKELSVRHGLAGSEAATAKIETLRKELDETKARLAASEKNLRESMVRIRGLTAEQERLLAAVKTDPGADDAARGRPSVKEARELLDEEDEDRSSPVSRDELAQLRQEGQDELSDGPSLLPKRDPNMKAPKALEEKEDKTPAAPSVERPKSYVVKEGDTLYGVAKRFYGSVLVWKKIREANKARISMDNRLRVGDTLVLPEP